MFVVSSLKNQARAAVLLPCAGFLLKKYIAFILPFIFYLKRHGSYFEVGCLWKENLLDLCRPLKNEKNSAN